MNIDDEIKSVETAIKRYELRLESYLHHGLVKSAEDTSRDISRLKMKLVSLKEKR